MGRWKWGSFGGGRSTSRPPALVGMWLLKTLVLWLLLSWSRAEFLNPGIEETLLPSTPTPGNTVPVTGQPVPADGLDKSTTQVPAEKAPSDKRYHVWSVEFTRVETPFMIGLWIFFSSIAKIGKSQLK